MICTSEVAERMKRRGELEKNYIHRIQHDMLFRKWLARFRERSGTKRKQSYMFSWLGPSDISKAKTKSPILMEKYEQLITSHKYFKMHKITRENKYFPLYKLKLFKKKSTELYYYLSTVFKNIFLSSDTSDRHHGISWHVPGLSIA